MQMGPSLLSADQKYPEPLQQQQQQPYPGYASLPPNANLSLVTGVSMESPIAGSNPYYASLLMLRPPSGSPHTDPSTREEKLFSVKSSNVMML